MFTPFVWLSVRVIHTGGLPIFISWTMRLFPSLLVCLRHLQSLARCVCHSSVICRISWNLALAQSSMVAGLSFPLFCHIHTQCCHRQIPVILRIFLYLYPLTTARRNATFLSSAEICRLIRIVGRVANNRSISARQHMPV